jgi:hypothetical protein
MQTSKYLLAAGLLAAVVLPLQVQGGPDTEEQAKMRAALRRALEEPTAPESQPAAKPAATPQPAVVTPPQPEPTPAPVAAVAPPPVAAATATVVVATPESFEAVPPADDAASIARARELMRQKLQELRSGAGDNGGTGRARSSCCYSSTSNGVKAGPGRRGDPGRVDCDIQFQTDRWAGLAVFGSQASQAV